jgi:hypothetical protein
MTTEVWCVYAGWTRCRDHPPIKSKSASPHLTPPHLTPSPPPLLGAWMAGPIHAVVRCKSNPIPALLARILRRMWACGGQQWWAELCAAGGGGRTQEPRARALHLIALAQSNSPAHSCPHSCPTSRACPTPAHGPLPRVSPPRSLPPPPPPTRQATASPRTPHALCCAPAQAAPAWSAPAWSAPARAAPAEAAPSPVPPSGPASPLAPRRRRHCFGPVTMVKPNSPIVPRNRRLSAQLSLQGSGGGVGVEGRQVVTGQLL